MVYWNYQCIGWHISMVNSSREQQVVSIVEWKSKKQNNLNQMICCINNFTELYIQPLNIFGGRC